MESLHIETVQFNLNILLYTIYIYVCIDIPASKCIAYCKYISAQINSFELLPALMSNKKNLSDSSLKVFDPGAFISFIYNTNQDHILFHKDQGFLKVNLPHAKKAYAFYLPLVNAISILLSTYSCNKKFLRT
ncbi:hypothetical protein [Acinetobacter gyllenbergii]|uniref:hypothetical protein n=1 Tax=Acinetobacter gyllenbergii TaxID=134534 RepID=UPI003F568D4E